jgi:hydrogenase nickel incorporation protein HypA/HybF
MHELALADAVVTTALRAAQESGIASIDRLEVRIGELQRISRETFEFALREILPRERPMIAQAAITLTTEPARFRCRPCGHEFSLVDTGGPQGTEAAEAIHFIPELAHAYLACPACASPDFEVLAGRGVSIARIEGESG